MLSQMTTNKLENLQKRLKELIQSKAFLRRSSPEKPFKLASGGDSWKFFDCKPVTQDPEGIAIIAEIIFELVKDYKPDGIGGIATGAIPICTAVAYLSHLKGQPIPAFWVREEPKKHGTKNKIEGGLQPGSRVVILDDVITKGTSVRKALDTVQEINCEVVEIITMVDREEGARQKFEEEGFKFTSLFKMSDFIKS